MSSLTENEQVYEWKIKKAALILRGTKPGQQLYKLIELHDMTWIVKFFPRGQLFPDGSSRTTCAIFLTSIDLTSRFKCQIEMGNHLQGDKNSEHVTFVQGVSQGFDEFMECSELPTCIQNDEFTIKITMVQ